jgi:predicted kinase
MVNIDMKLNEIASEKQIVLVCGNIASGKGHYARQYFPGYKVISVSDVVKSITKFKTRSALGTTKDLDQLIADRLIEEIEPYEKVVVDGIRQISIMKRLQAHFLSAIKDIIWLDTPTETSKSRFETRQAGKDDMSFEQALQSDKELGIGDVEDYIRKNHRVIPY